MEKVKDVIKKLYYDKRIRFLFVGVLNTIVGFGITSLVYLCFGIKLFSKEEIPVIPMIVGTLSGQVIGTIHSYFWNKYFTFRVKEKSGAEFLRFVLVYVLQYLLSLGLTALFNLWITIPALVTVITILVCTVLSYIGHNFFSFRKKTEKAEDTDKEI